LKRRLQMFVSVLFGAIAVLTVALWIRSYLVLQETIVSTVGNHTYYAEISRGSFRLGISPPYPNLDKWQTLMRGQTYAIPISPSNIEWTRHGAIRYWHFFVVALFLAALPWMRSRYSLRTLLIVTTVIAIAIGFTFATS
jgi:hypothetical protein